MPTVIIFNFERNNRIVITIVPVEYDKMTHICVRHCDVDHS